MSAPAGAQLAIDLEPTDKKGDYKRVGVFEVATDADRTMQAVELYLAQAFGDVRAIDRLRDQDRRMVVIKPVLIYDGRFSDTRYQVTATIEFRDQRFRLTFENALLLDVTGVGSKPVESANRRMAYPNLDKLFQSFGESLAASATSETDDDW
ncbi:MAG: hypothetical protein AAFR07_05745 [Pseudomonadota bacterium]